VEQLRSIFSIEEKDNVVAGYHGGIAHWSLMEVVLKWRKYFGGLFLLAQDVDWLLRKGFAM